MAAEAPDGVDAPVVAGAPASPAGVDLASMTDAEREQWKRTKWVWCTVCAGGSIKKEGWSHKTRTGHVCSSLKKAGKEDEAKREFLFVKRGGQPAVQALVKQKQQAEAGCVRPDLPPPPPEPVLTFGQYENAKLKDILFSDDLKKKEYIPWLFASSSAQARGQYLDELEASLRQGGLWEQTQQMSRTTKPYMYSRHVTKLVEGENKLAAGEHVHKDIVEMRKLQG